MPGTSNCHDTGNFKSLDGVLLGVPEIHQHLPLQITKRPLEIRGTAELKPPLRSRASDSTFRRTGSGHGSLKTTTLELLNRREERSFRYRISSALIVRSLPSRNRKRRKAALGSNWLPQQASSGTAIHSKSAKFIFPVQEKVDGKVGDLWKHDLNNTSAPEENFDTIVRT